MINFVKYFYRYTSLIYTLYSYITSKEDEKIIILDKLIEKIKCCGSVAIKFCQWSIPKLEVMHLKRDDIHNNIKPLWLNKFEQFYENCETHDMKYTFDTYKKIFNQDITSDYEILDIIGSGSIGQVYLLTDKPLTEFTDPKKYIMKIVHPDVRNEIYYFRIYYNIIKQIPFIKNTINRNFPFDINGFIDSFDEQSNFINESNNLISFHEYYLDNDSIIIPRLIKCSKDIIIMSYEEGVSFDDIRCDKYNKYKIALLLTSFIRNNQRITNLNHGDLHKGNWKVKVDEGDYKLVIYDFGFSWRTPITKKRGIEEIVEVFEKSDTNNVDIDKMVSVFELLIKNGENKTESVKQYLRDNISNIRPWILDPHRFFNIIVDMCITYKLEIDPVLIQCIIIVIQCEKIFSEYNFTSTVENTIESTEVYRKKYLDFLAYYKTNNIFQDYSKLIMQKLNDEQTEINSIFDCDKMPDSIKLLALKNV
jgi:predicted unusual protein kinase regulating ubiquinone biosynthesis (AarF/ABC1/UbiB family)